MLSFFEKLTNAYPDEQPTTPPAGLYAFIRHYTRGMEWPLMAITILTAAIAVLEVMLFSFLGNLVDWLAAKSPENFLKEEGGELAIMALILLVVMPAITVIHTLVTHQTLLGNYPMAIRWRAHRYLLNQSMSFYENDFAGRLATKVMQTSLSVRETVLKLLDVFVYAVVYFVSILVVVFQSNSILMLPLLFWALAYIGIQLFFIPRLKRISTLQADARSLMTGRIVDSYTNISTIKLFSHTDKETEYSKSAMDEFLQTVYKQMRLSTGIELSVTLLNYLLIFMLTAVAISLWLKSAVSIGAIAIAISLALRLNGMSHWIMWELSALFENLGTTVDGMNTLSKPLTVTDVANARDLKVDRGEIRYKDVGFHYGSQSNAHENADEATQLQVIDNLNLTIAPGEKVGVVGRSGAGKSQALVNLR